MSSIERPSPQNFENNKVNTLYWRTYLLLEIVPVKSWNQLEKMWAQIPKGGQVPPRTLVEIGSRVVFHRSYICIIVHIGAFLLFFHAYDVIVGVCASHSMLSFAPLFLLPLYVLAILFTMHAIGHSVVLPLFTIFFTTHIFIYRQVVPSACHVRHTCWRRKVRVIDIHVVLMRQQSCRRLLSLMYVSALMCHTLFKKSVVVAKKKLKIFLFFGMVNVDPLNVL
jgi:hypothetical protein